ncbi:MAG: hypothetical protein A4E65_02179 [Syntrophorhabdus sp. PtaU1.Bin153]|nr:MAG: hypothetical protein A4E65_02179 [Syntrophorhabdus sp. PtaU1.Bin153]
MRIKYYPHKYMENIPLSVNKDIESYHRKGDSLEIQVRGKEAVDTIDLNNIRGMVGKRIRQIGSISSYGAVEALFLFAVVNAFQRPFSLYSVYIVVMGMIMVGVIGYMLKTNVEKYMYGGFECVLGEIYFQSDQERAQFNDSLMNASEKKKKKLRKQEGGEEK